LYKDLIKVAYNHSRFPTGFVGYHSVPPMMAPPPGTLVRTQTISGYPALPPNMPLQHDHFAYEEDYVPRRPNSTCSGRSGYYPPDSRPHSPDQTHEGADAVLNGTKEFDEVLERRQESTGPVRTQIADLKKRIAAAEAPVKARIKNDLPYLKREVFQVPTGALWGENRRNYEKYRDQLSASQDARLRDRPPAPKTPPPLNEPWGKSVISATADRENRGLSGDRQQLTHLEQRWQRKLDAEDTLRAENAKIKASLEKIRTVAAHIGHVP
jgi:hypothetical protein